MEQQIQLFEKSQNKITEKINVVDLKQEKKDRISYCLSAISKESYLWDMRCWDKYKDREEIIAWIKNPDRINNCGHINYCVNELLRFGVDIELIIKAIMNNPNIQYKNRLVKCWVVECPRKVKANGYSECGCEGCE